MPRCSELPHDGCVEPSRFGPCRVSRSRRRKLQVFRTAVFLVMGAFFLVPIGAMFEFCTRGNGVTAARTLDAWTAIGEVPDLLPAICVSLQLAELTAIAL